MDNILHYTITHL